MKLDEKDKKILALLKENSSLSTSSISKKTTIPITTVHNRIKKLNDEGYISQYTIKENFEKLNRGLGAFIMINVDNTSSGPPDQQKIGKHMKLIEDVENVFFVTGTTDIVLRVQTCSIKSLNNIIINKIRKIHGLETSTMIILEEI